MQRKLSKSITEPEFDNGYWYTTELQEFAHQLEIPHAKKLRKDELEKAIRQFIQTGSIAALPPRTFGRTGPSDVEKGLSLKLPVVNYTNDKTTKDFIFREARRIDKSFKIKAGTRYLLNRWREEQIAGGKNITYEDVVKKIMDLAHTQHGPLRIAHGRYNNFISDFMAKKAGTRSQAVKAWRALKKMDCPKTFQAWNALKSKT